MESLSIQIARWWRSGYIWGKNFVQWDDHFDKVGKMVDVDDGGDNGHSYGSLVGAVVDCNVFYVQHSRARLTVRILRYEIKRGWERSVYVQHGFVFVAEVFPNYISIFATWRGIRKTATVFISNILLRRGANWNLAFKQQGNALFSLGFASRLTGLRV